MPSFVAPLRATPLTAAHRDGAEKHHQHDCYGDDDDNDSRPNGEGDEQGLVHSVFLPGPPESNHTPARNLLSLTEQTLPTALYAPMRRRASAATTERYVLRP
jgi:hypothetical protein